MSHQGFELKPVSQPALVVIESEDKAYDPSYSFAIQIMDAVQTINGVWDGYRPLSL